MTNEAGAGQREPHPPALRFGPPGARLLDALTWLCAVQIFAFFALAATIAALAYSLGANCSARWMGVSAMLAFAATAAASSIAYPKLRSRLIRLVSFASLINLGLVLAAGALCNQFTDYSWDGQWYHHDALRALLRGWNPVFEQHQNLFVQHYPYGVWALRKVFAGTFGSIEAGKVTNCMALVASFGVVYHAATEALQISRNKALLLAALMALTPTAVSQALTFYVDGYLSSVLTAAIALTVCLIKLRTPIYSIALAALIILAVNAKFTGLVYVALLLGPLGVAVLLVKRKRGIILLATLTVGVALGAGLVGYHPYVTNLTSKGDPFFPASTQLLANKADPIFLSFSPAKREAVSLFALAEARVGERPIVKIPFTTTWNEVMQSGYYDIRFGGYGPFFSGAMILGLVALAWNAHKFGRVACWALGGSLLVLASAVVMPADWWPRLAPHVALVPTVCLAGLWTCNSRVAAGLAAVSSLNAACVLGAWLTETARADAQFHRDIQLLREHSRTHPILLKEQFDSTTYRLDELGIRYAAVKNLECPLPYSINGLRAQVCFDVEENDALPANRLTESRP